MIRQKRLKPCKERLNTPWVYTDTDKQILTYLARYRYLRGTTLHELIPTPVYTINRRLRILFDRRLIDKPITQALGYNSLNDTDIYEITTKGEAQLTSTVPEATNLLRFLSDAPVKNFKHAMMICDALSSIEIGAKASGCTFITQAEILAKIDHEHPTKLPCTVKYTYSAKSTLQSTTFLIPDGVFGIRYPNGQTRLYLLEAEHYNPVFATNLNRASFLKKMLGYEDIRAKGTIRQLGKSNFHVLFVFPTPTRAQTARQLVETVLGGSSHILINHTPVQEEIWRSPRPYPELFTGEWLRGGLPAVSIKEAPTD
jgi:hypothetical protein